MMAITTSPMSDLSNNILILFTTTKKSVIKRAEVNEKLFELGKKYGDNWLSRRIIKISNKYNIHPLEALAFISTTSRARLVRKYCEYLLSSKEVSSETRQYTHENWVSKLNRIYYDS